MAPSGQPAALYLLAEAHQQSAKNGWKHDDLEAIRRGLTLAIEATEAALALDPGNAAYRRVLNDRLQRLAELPEPSDPIAGDDRFGRPDESGPWAIRSRMKRSP